MGDSEKPIVTTKKDEEKDKEYKGLIKTKPDITTEVVPVGNGKVKTFQVLKFKGKGGKVLLTKRRLLKIEKAGKKK